MSCPHPAVTTFLAFVYYPNGKEIDQCYAMTSHVIAHRLAELLFGMHALKFNCFLDVFNAYLCKYLLICTADSAYKLSHLGLLCLVMSHF